MDLSDDRNRMLEVVRVAAANASMQQQQRLSVTKALSTSMQTTSRLLFSVHGYNYLLGVNIDDYKC
jgi:hypothetical protein